VCGRLKSFVRGERARTFLSVNNIDMPKRTKNRRPRANMARVQRSLKPPMFKAYIPTRHTFRYSFAPTVSTNLTSTVVSNLTNNTMLNSFGILATAANTGYNWYSSFKVHSIKIWGSYFPTTSSTSLASAQIEVDWGTGALNFVPSQLINDTSNDPSVPAFISTAPMVGSEQSFWQQSTSSNFMTLVYNCPVVVDLDVSLSTGDSRGLSVSPAATLTIGDQYFLPLDGISSHNLQAVGLPGAF